MKALRTIQEWISYLVPDDGRTYVLKDDYAALEATLAAKDKEIARMKEHTWCAYCGYEIFIDDAAATKISEHITNDCPTHPLRIALTALAQKDEKFIEERQHAEWLQRQIDEDVTIICTRNAEIAKKNKEIERLSKRDCNATIQLIWPREDDPWNKISLKVVDVGVSDNIYVVECQEIVKKDQEISLWKQSYNAASQDNEELREENAILIKDAALNAQMLARQTDLAREAETKAAKLRNALDVVQANYDIYTTALVKFVVEEALK